MLAIAMAYCWEDDDDSDNRVSEAEQEVENFIRENRRRHHNRDRVNRCRGRAAARRARRRQGAARECDQGLVALAERLAAPAEAEHPTAQPAKGRPRLPRRRAAAAAAAAALGYRQPIPGIVAEVPGFLDAGIVPILAPGQPQDEAAAPGEPLQDKAAVPGEQLQDEAVAPGEQLQNEAAPGGEHLLPVDASANFLGAEVIPVSAPE
ncbi:hypothetical protein QAD02_007183 [Eretmocerus hayati]|uniref:Uncharacterized protein n=1 Tax=Eretmocerus hayati TaxID=131215 RepID=A0ACC2N3U2_9HYME|nr:hypothetical protein QAD02_007183 [Eretmocerus hayati]